MDPISTSTYNLSILGQSSSTTSLSKYEKRNFKNLLPQIIAAVISTSNHITVGISLAYSAILIPQLEAKNSDISVTKGNTSLIASAVALVAPIGAILAGVLMDRYGRVKALKLSFLPGVLAWVLIALAPNVPILIIGRVVAGLAASLVSSPAIVYVTEIARKDMRGSLLALGPAFVSLGMVISYVKGWLLNWRTVAWLNHIYLIVPFLLFFLIPESPVWLISKGRHDKAKKALTWLHKYQPQPPNQPHSYAEMQFHQLIKEEEQKKFEAARIGGSTIREFLKPTGWKPLLIISGVFFFQQFAGIYIFLFYSVSFFQEVGTSVDPYIASIFIGVIRLVMSLLNTWMLKNMRRRLLIMVSAFGMGISMLVSGLFTQWIKNGTTTLTWVPAIFLLLYVVTSMIGLLTIPWTMTAELFPLKIRSLAHSTATCIVNVIMFLAVQNYFKMVDFFGGSAGIQWFFAGVSFLAIAYFFVFLPETHEKKLTEIEDYFKNNTIYLGQKKPPVPPRLDNNNGNKTEIPVETEGDRLIKTV